MRKSSILLFIIKVLIGTLLLSLYDQYKAEKKKAQQYQLNTNALLETIDRLQIDSTTMALDVHTLSLSVEEYKKHREEDTELIEKLGVRIKDLEVAAKHTLKVEIPLNTVLTDTIIIRDSIPVPLKTLSIDTPHLRVDGIIEKNDLSGKIELPIKLNQVVWIDYKHKFLCWKWKPKGIHQVITSDNPYANIEYSEFIFIQK